MNSITHGLVIVAASVLAVLVIGVVAAAPVGQGPLLPTPTPYPVGDLAYTLSEVGGAPYRESFEHAAQDGITPGATTVESLYPGGMVFRVSPESANGAIESVTLFAEFPGGSRTRLTAQPGAVEGDWIALLGADNARLPAWAHIAFSWRVRDESGVVIDTAPQPVDYVDTTRTWHRLDTPQMVVYWFGLDDDDPAVFAEVMAWALESTHQRRVDGFGEALGYVPVGVIFSSTETMGETTGSGAVNRGGAFYQYGQSVLAVVDGGVEFQRDWMSFTTVHELVHLYQFSLLGGLNGPAWWVEGQAQWFATHPGEYDARLRNLATLQAIPTLTREVPREVAQADGRPNLAYDMGASFINWLVAEYGIETHAEIVRLQREDGLGVIEAIEAAAGVTFFDLQNDWRAYIGAPPFTLADLDPASALDEPVNPVAAVGDTLTLPVTPALVPLAEQPGPRSLASGQCFASMAVTVLRVGSLEGVDYYEVDCMGMTGWVTAETLGVGR